MQQLHKCLECGESATWMRATQFAGDHPYCDAHANFQTDFGQNDSYSFWYKIQTPDEIGTLEGQREFDMNRNYHYTNTNNPVDFPSFGKDPKPELNPSSIRANVEYFLAIARKHELQATAARRMADFWQNQLK